MSPTAIGTIIVEHHEKIVVTMHHENGDIQGTPRIACMHSLYLRMAKLVKFRGNVDNRKEQTCSPVPGATAIPRDVLCALKAFPLCLDSSSYRPDGMTSCGSLAV